MTLEYFSGITSIEVYFYSNWNLTSTILFLTYRMQLFFLSFDSFQIDFGLDLDFYPYLYAFENNGLIYRIGSYLLKNIYPSKSSTS